MNNNAHPLNSPSWTLSSMFLVEIVMVSCFFFNKKFFTALVLPLSLIVGFGYWRMKSTDGIEDWIGFTTFGTLRTWLVYCCAYYCMKLGGWLRKADLTRLSRILLTVLETLCHIFAFIVMTHKSSRYWQWCTLLAFFVAVAIAISGRSLWNTALQRFSRITGFLSSFSLSIYLIHRPITRYFEHLYPDVDTYYAHLLPMLAAIVVCSLAHYLLVTGLIRLCRKNGNKIKALFIKAPDGTA